MLPRCERMCVCACVCVFASFYLAVYISHAIDYWTYESFDGLRFWRLKKRLITGAITKYDN